MLKVGDKAPNFTVNDQDGNPVKLSDLRGSKVVLYFYPRDMTPGCTAEACNLRDNYKSMQKKGYEILGVSTDSEKSHRKFIEKERLPFRLLADTEKDIHNAYGTWVEKSMYGRKYMGTARVTFVIDEKGIIEDIIDKVDTRNHVDQILNSKVEDTAKVAVKKAPAKKAAKTARKSPRKKA
jgi:peroxiredoxin Q/BCP